MRSQDLVMRRPGSSKRFLNLITVVIVTVMAERKKTMLRAEKSVLEISLENCSDCTSYWIMNDRVPIDWQRSDSLDGVE